MYTARASCQIRETARNSGSASAPSSRKTRVAEKLGGTRPIARLLESADGGPVRRIVNGRQTKYTGFFVAVKADFAQMPWESRKAEKAMLVLSEASPRVVSLLTQPHRLEIFINEQKAPLRYFPDLRLRVHPSLLEDLRDGMPFSAAALARACDETDELLKTVIIEIKDDRDRRQHEKKYRRKLELAEEVYSRLGIEFLVVHRGDDIMRGDLRLAYSVVAWRHTHVSQSDIWALESALRSGAGTADIAVAHLGGGALGWAKLRALHVRRIIQIDLTAAVGPESAVWLPENNSLRVGVRS